MRDRLVAAILHGHVCLAIRANDLLVPLYRLVVRRTASPGAFFDPLGCSVRIHTSLSFAYSYIAFLTSLAPGSFGGAPFGHDACASFRLTLLRQKIPRRS